MPVGTPLIFWCATVAILQNAVLGERLVDVMSKDLEISEFVGRLLACKKCNFTLENDPITIFAPINTAFNPDVQQFNEKDALVQYHITNIPRRTDQLGTSSTSLNSILIGSPPLWITHSSGRYHDDIYVNNAQIFVSQSNVVTKDNGITQILHKIDDVLIPTGPIQSAYNPTAWEFLENYESLTWGSPHRVRNFRQKIQQNRKEEIFRVEGGHTFFIPVDEGFVNARAALIDDKIIDGHVVPQQVLFTTPTKKDVPYQTMANGDNNLRVVVIFTQEKKGPIVKNYVKSHTLFSDAKHTNGIVLAEIVKANIPVKNGVIHLIHKPLMIVDSTVKELLEEKSEGILSNFVDAIKDSPGGQELLNKLEKSPEITLFAPCNMALENDMTARSIRKNPEILKLHIVEGKRLYVDSVERQPKPYQVGTLASKDKTLYFNVVTVGSNKTMTVEGGGVNATVLQADLAAKNGVIHIIDRVLGVPFSTVLDILKTNPILSKTYKMGNLKGFNAKLNATHVKYTYFVPRDQAWDDAALEFPSAIRKLFMPEYAYHATQTLERHLVESDTVYTMQKIKEMMDAEDKTNTLPGRRGVELPSVRGNLRLYVEKTHDNTYVIHWKGKQIRVFRPNVECTNGIIHVIDFPFLEEGDIRVGASTANFASPFIIMGLIIVKFLAH